jgi:transposase
MCIQRMQKALTQMNVQLANVISDLSGITGQRIVRAILAGDRDSKKLAQLADPRIRASQDEIAQSLEGTWQPELLFVLKQEMALHDIYQERISECDRELRTHLKSLANRLLDEPPVEEDTIKQPTTKPSRITKRNKKTQGHAPDFNLAGELQRISGVDLTRIDGIDVMVAQTIISEVGLDMNRWKTEAHFASWLGLCPDNRISGDRVLGKGTRHVVNRAATALRMASTTLLKSKSYLGAQYRRLRTKLGAPKAITPMAHKLARLVYRMLKYGQEYLDRGMEYYDERYRRQQIHLLKKRAAALGLNLVETPAA